jgi:hypothetical protein
MCARTRTNAVECVATYPRVAYRHRLPIENVTHLARFVPAGTSEAGVCARGGPNAACWSFSHDGKTSTRFSFDAGTATAVALRTPSEIATAWHESADTDVYRAGAIAVSEDRDEARIVGRDASIAVRCAIAHTQVLTCYGPGVYGELGDGALRTKARLSRPLGDAPVSGIAIRRHRVCAALVDGRVACWGELPSKKARRLPMCPPDWRESEDRFIAARGREHARAQECTEGCKAHPVLDCQLNCAEHCVAFEVVFKHEDVCQEPAESVVKGECTRAGQPARPPSEAELRDHTREVHLSLSPVFLDQVNDAAAVEVWGRDVCILRRSGTVTCLTL